MRWQGILGVATAAAGALAFSGCGDEPIEPRPMPASTLAKAAPAISGGTLAKVHADLFAAADPDTDQIHFVDFGTDSVESVDLEPGDEPGRLAVGGGKVYAALRSGGALVGIDVATLAVTRLDVCAAPRGVVYDAGLVHVACATGELVTVDENLEGIVRSVGIDRDLRDVVLLGDGNLGVSVFRSAELIVVHSSGAVLTRQKASNAMLENTFIPAVAWRSIPLEGGVLMLHQRGTVAPVPIEREPGAPPQSSPYGGAPSSPSGPVCAGSGILHAGATLFDAQGATTSQGFVLGPIVLPVDIAVEGSLYAAVGAGSNVVVTGSRSQLDVTETAFNAPQFPCPQMDGITVTGEPIAVALDDGQVVVQRRQPAGLLRISRSNHELLNEVTFGGPNRRQVGHMVFHQAASPSSAIACASCHPEGREDGRVWTFEKIGARRTQTVAGGVLDTAPLHWDGEFDAFDGLMRDVFVQRMGGREPTQAQLGELAGWMQTLPHLPSRALGKSDAVARGEALYHDATVGCASCHGGDKLTNNQTMAVGTGIALQVPSLVGIADRAPFMHNGCAATLTDRFDPQCGGGDLHGVTSHLSEAQISDLVAYLDTL